MSLSLPRPCYSPKLPSSYRQVRITIPFARHLVFDMNYRETPGVMGHSYIFCYRNPGVYGCGILSRFSSPSQAFTEVHLFIIVINLYPVTDRYLRRSFAVAASMFMNSNSLPIALMQSLVVTVPGLKWDEDDNKDVMLGRALTYLVLYSTLGMIVRLLLSSLESKTI
jgi:hypothetical protein